MASKLDLPSPVGICLVDELVISALWNPSPFLASKSHLNIVRPKLDELC